MKLATLNEVKTILEIPLEDRSEDVKLNFFISFASAWILEYLNRPDIEYKQRTEYYEGTGTKKLPLRSRPVYPADTIEVYIDSGAWYGSVDGSFGSASQLTYGRDFCLEIDRTTTGKNRSGILMRINNVWPKPSARQAGYLAPFITSDMGSIKVVYYGGYTQDDLPENLRLACHFLVARLRYMFPIGMEMNSESYEDRFISFSVDKKEYLVSMVKPLIMPFRNWVW